jgi:hypothetical protein
MLATLLGEVNIRLRQCDSVRIRDPTVGYRMAVPTSFSYDPDTLWPPVIASNEGRADGCPCITSAIEACQKLDFNRMRNERDYTVEHKETIKQMIGCLMEALSCLSDAMAPFKRDRVVFRGATRHLLTSLARDLKRDGYEKAYSCMNDEAPPFPVTLARISLPPHVHSDHDDPDILMNHLPVGIRPNMKDRERMKVKGYGPQHDNAPAAVAKTLAVTYFQTIWVLMGWVKVFGNLDDFCHEDISLTNPCPMERESRHKTPNIPQMIRCLSHAMPVAKALSTQVNPSTDPVAHMWAVNTFFQTRALIVAMVGVTVSGGGAWTHDLSEELINECVQPCRPHKDSTAGTKSIKITEVVSFMLGRTITDLLECRIPSHHFKRLTDALVCMGIAVPQKSAAFHNLQMLGIMMKEAGLWFHEDEDVDTHETHKRNSPE